MTDQVLLPLSGGHQGGSLFPAFFVGSVFAAGGDRRRVGVSLGQGLHNIAQLRRQAGHGADAVSNLLRLPKPKGSRTPFSRSFPAAEKPSSLMQPKLKFNLFKYK